MRTVSINRAGGVLTGNPPFARLVPARTLSVLGDFIARTALALYVWRAADAAAAVGMLFFVIAIARLASPIAGALVDRHDQRTVMVVCDLGQLLVYGVIAATLPAYAAVLALVFVAELLATAFAPAGRSSIPALVPEAHLSRANAVLAGTTTGAVTIGGLAGGVLVAAVGTRLTIAANAATFAVSALLLLALPSLRARSEADVVQTSLLADAREGVRYLRHHQLARLVVLLVVAIVFCGGLGRAALVVLAERTLDGGSSGYGMLVTSVGVGLVIGSLAVGRFAPRHDPTRLLVLAGIAQGAARLGVAGAPNLVLAAVALAIAGVGNAVENVASDTRLQSAVDSAVLGRVYGLMLGGVFVADAAGSAAGGWLVAATSARTSFVLAGTGMIATVALVTASLGRPNHHSEPGS